uniref:Serine/threonine-protein phosphatase with EF-hands n=1 Tax=Erpetoichthys calabaricus TaxID=27687 RepID=A0A8C4RHN1_ERPCA
MGCGSSTTTVDYSLKKSERAMKAAILIQRWYRRYTAHLEVRRRCTWTIFQSIEYSGEQDQIKVRTLQKMELKGMMFEKEINEEMELEKYYDFENIHLSEGYKGPHLCFPLTASHAAALVEAFRHKQHLHARYVLQLLLETWKLLKLMPNINRVSTCYNKEITVCGDLKICPSWHNGLPSVEKPYIFNGDYVDRGKDSIEILMILFAFLLVYPNQVHLNRGNHEDYIVNLRYGFTKEVMQKYKVHGKKILRLLQIVFSWLPLATIIDQKILIIHGGISRSTDLDVIATIDRHKYVSAVKQPKRRKTTRQGQRQPGECCCGINRNDSSPVPSTYRSGSDSRPLNSISKGVRLSVDKELERCRKQVGLSDDTRVSLLLSESDTEQYEASELENAEWKQVVDILWSDPVNQEGCIPNVVRGGGCYFGPDVTKEVLEKHNFQLLIRSHECKQDGYEFCHNRKVLTIFSASNYYEEGSNRGAYVRMGPDLIPHFVQYQSSKTTRKLTMRQRVSRVERSAIRDLREQLFAHRCDLLRAFEQCDKTKKGKISLNDWANTVESVMQLGLPWRILRSQLVPNTTDGHIDYQAWFEHLAIEQPIKETPQSSSLLETLYRNRSNLETIFRLIDSDSSGLISFEEFRQTWKLLSSHLNTEISDQAISDLARSIDFNKDGNIDINEFMEAFRLVDRNPS